MPNKLEWIDLDPVFHDKSEQYRIVRTLGRFMLVQTRRDGELIGEYPTLRGAKWVAARHSKKSLVKW